MLIAIGIIIGLLISIADIVFVLKSRRVKGIIHALVRDTVLINLFHYGVMKYIFRTENIYSVSAHENTYWLLSIGMCLAVAVIYFLAIFLLHKFSLGEKSEIKRKKGNVAVKIIGLLLFALGVAALTGTVWGKDFFGDLTPDQILINLNSPTEGTDASVYISAIEGPFLSTALFTAIYCLFAFSDRKFVFRNKEKTVTVLPVIALRAISLVLAVSMLAGGCAYGINQFQLVQLYHSYLTASEFIEENFADPNTVKLTFPEEKRNLIHIYLESMENTFLSKELGGFCEDNLIPHLYDLSFEGISFSNKEEGLGGFLESTGAGWSVASMVNMGTGLPMKVPDKQNQYGDADNFLPGVTAIGDILKAQGYEQTVMFGANADFGGLTYYFKSHGDFTIIDHKEAKKRGYIPQNYKVFWGYEDDKLYEYAKEELIRLYETGKPFHFMMETADTHTPEGYLSPKAPKPYDDKYANAVRYSQEETYNFVRWIQEQPFYENTTIVLIGDHLSMAKKFFEGLDGIKKYHRTCYNLILNPAEGLSDVNEDRLFDRDWAVFDMFPTLLASIGVEIEGDRLGIGTNLFSDRDTVFEEFGVDFVNDELVKRSNFYNFNILISNNKGEQ
ncbi:MAG: LTA synthase family protein [Clostridia bacterium]|nr:LTA synthase family protein [Clostridia bacterium]